MIRKFKEHSPILGNNVYIDEQAVVIGQVEIGEDTSIWPTAVIRGDMHQIKIGARCSIQDGTICHVTHDSQYYPGGSSLTIGNDVTVGHQAILHGCIIHDQCLIGMQSVILDGAVIESKVMLGAGSLVSPGKVLKSGYLYVGRPAVQKRKLTDEEIDFMLYSAQSYVKLKDSYI